MARCVLGYAAAKLSVCGRLVPRGGRHVSLAVALGLLPDGMAACTVLSGPIALQDSSRLQVPRGEHRL